MSNIEELKSIFIENWSSVFNTILGRDVKVDIGEITKINNVDLSGKLENFDSFVTLSYGEAEEKIALLTNNKLVSIISNLMIGLDSFTEEINDDDKDAFGEGVNQMFSACQVPIKEELGLDMKFTGVSFADKSEITKSFAGDVNVWNVSIELPEISTEEFVLVSPAEFGQSADSESSSEEMVNDNAGGKKVEENNNRSSSYEGTNIDLILDVELPITIRIGSTEKKLVEIMRLGLGSIIELEKVVDDPVDVLVNNVLVAKGEVVVLDSNFAIRIIDVESKAKRIQSLV